MDEDRLVPTVLEKMFSTVELKGLFMEGLYRKSASVAQVKQVRRTLETCPGLCPLEVVFYILTLR